ARTGPTPVDCVRRTGARAEPSGRPERVRQERPGRASQASVGGVGTGVGFNPAAVRSGPSRKPLGPLLRGAFSVFAPSPAAKTHCRAGARVETMTHMIDHSALATTPTLTGERIRLVPLQARHARDVYQSLQDPVSRRLTGTHTTFTFDQIERFCASRDEQDDRLDFAIEDIATGTYAGGMALNGIDVHNESGGFRVDLVEDYRGQGHGPEAIRLMLAYAFDVIGLHRVRLEVFDFNEHAMRAYQKCGFVLEGREREALMWEGQRYDMLIMAVLKGDVVW